MILEKIKENCVRLAQAGIQSSNSRFENEQIEDLIHTVRNELLIQSVNGSKTRGADKMISGSWYQSTYLNIVVADQDPGADFLLFSKPRVVRVNEHVNGVLFFGREKSPKPFTQLRGWDQAADALTLGEIYPNGGEHFIDEGDRFVIFGNANLKRAKLVAILENPLDDTSFNVYTDNYPIPVDLLGELYLIVSQRLLGIAAQKVPSTTQDGNDLPKTTK